jgi:histidinol dehydrogenase
MKVVKYPDKEELRQICLRPAIESETLSLTVEQIVNHVRSQGDSALLAYSLEFDFVALKSLRVTESHIYQAEISAELEEAIDTAIENITIFHAVQRREEQQFTTYPGITCFRRRVPIETVGLYIPGGSAPLISTLLMLAIPSKLSGCKRVVVCTPPQEDGTINAGILVAARKLGISEIYTVGGAQAIAALAFGTETIPKVDKIFGPGNQYVSAAKAFVSQLGTAIDLPAGPSELAIVTDGNCPLEFIAADLLSQAEHGPDSQVLLISWNEKCMDKIAAEIQLQLEQLPRKEIAKASLDNSSLILVENQQRAMEVVNAYAPEHLILAVSDPNDLVDKVINAGSVFLGNYTPESLGDYASGTNHVLPTNGAARAYSGVSLDSFMKTITFQTASPEGLKSLGQTVVTLARAENLEGHAKAVLRRISSND